MITVDRTSHVPLYRQVYDSVREGIIDGTWKPGERIPSVRDVVDQLAIGRNTVVNAYQQLSAEGYIESRHGSGYYVVDTSFDLLRTAESLRAAPLEPDKPGCDPAPAFEFDFAYGNMAPGSFPSNAWRKLLAEALDEGPHTGLTSYGEDQGLPGLREELARYLNRSRGVRCSPDQIVITSGVQSSVELLLYLFDPAIDVFGMEEPGFHPVRRIVQGARFKVVPLPSSEGASAYLHALRRAHPHIIYSTPSHQMPMGTHLSLDTRMQLIEIAIEDDAFIIEDDYDSVFRFGTQPIPTLQSLDVSNRVVYLGTFSKILAPSLRIGYMVIPMGLLPEYRRLLQGYRCTVPWIVQEALHRFMERGLWERHVRRVEHDIRARNELLVKEMQEAFADRVQLIGCEAGLHLLARVSGGMVQEELYDRAMQAGVRVGLTRQYWSDSSSSPDDLVMLAYSGIRQEMIPEGVARLASAWL